MTVAEETPTAQSASVDEPGRVQRVVVFVGTILVIIMLAVLPLLTPWFIHAALDAADSAVRLGIESAQAEAMSDRSVRELVLGPGDFAFDGPDGTPFYDEAERGHLGDARVLLWLFLIAGGVALILISAIYVRAPATSKAVLWRTISRAGLVTALTVVVLGLISLVAFGTLFTLFHQVFFPAGNWSFDPATQRLVQLYPFAFWQIAAAALGVLVFGIGMATWLLGRYRAGRVVQDATP